MLTLPDNLVFIGSFASLLAGLCTGLGATLIFVVRTLTDRVQDALLSFAAGIMLAASVFSLILPGIDYAMGQGLAELQASLVVIAGLFLGAIVLYLIHNHVPHEHLILGYEGPEVEGVKRVWLFVIAITLHNFPEGMAVGVGFGTGNIAKGTTLATGIGLQNVPEGLAVAASMLAIGYRRGQAFLIALLTGLVEPVGGFLAVLAVTAVEPLLPWALGFAAGAMLFVINGEIIPETHRGKYKNLASFALLTGFGLMMFLDVVFG